MFDWDMLIQEAANDRDLADSERVVVVAAFKDLRLILGEQLLSARHPLMSYWINRAPWVRRWTVWFLATLNCFRSEPWFEKLIDDLRNPNTCSERLVVLDVAARFAAGGFSIELDPTVTINGSPKKPDLFVRLGREPGLYIEVTDLYASAKEGAADGTFTEIADIIRFRFPDLWASWHLKRTLSPAHLAEIIQKVLVTMGRAQSELTLATLDLEGIFCMAAAPPSLAHALETWSRERGLELREGRGPQVEVSVLDRLASKLKREQEQLPQQHSNVVLINMPLYWRGVGSEPFFRELSHAFEEEAFKYSHVAYVALVCHWSGDNKNGDYQCGEHLCFNREDFDMLCRSSMVLRNRFARPTMTSRNQEALLKCIG